MTTIYFVRHAEPNIANHNDEKRELSKKGLADSLKLTNYLLDKDIHAIYSSPYVRAYDTVKDFAKTVNLPITVIDDLRERKISDHWISDFKDFAAKQWADFSYKLSGGESLADVQERNITAVNLLLDRHKQDHIVIATHGTALSTIVNYYQPQFTYQNFQEIKHCFPWIVKAKFTEKHCLSIVSTCLDSPSKEIIYTSN